MPISSSSKRLKGYLNSVSVGRKIVPGVCSIFGQIGSSRVARQKQDFYFVIMLSGAEINSIAGRTVNRAMLIKTSCGKIA